MWLHLTPVHLPPPRRVRLRLTLAHPATMSGATELAEAAAPRPLAPAVAPAVASGVAAPGDGAPAAAVLGATGLAETTAPALPAPAVGPAIAVEAPVAWTPADEPVAVEELLGREALANKEKKPSA